MIQNESESKFITKCITHVKIHLKYITHLKFSKFIQKLAQILKKTQNTYNNFLKRSSSINNFFCKFNFHLEKNVITNDISKQ